MSGKPDLLEAVTLFRRVDDAFSDELIALGLKWDDNGFDPYDSSVELYRAEPGSELTEAMQKVAYDYGFVKAYLNRSDGTAKVYNFGTVDGFKYSRGDPCHCNGHLPTPSPEGKQ